MCLFLSSAFLAVDWEDLIPSTPASLLPAHTTRSQVFAFALFRGLLDDRQDAFAQGILLVSFGLLQAIYGLRPCARNFAFGNLLCSFGRVVLFSLFKLWKEQLHAFWPCKFHISFVLFLHPNFYVRSFFDYFQHALMTPTLTFANTFDHFQPSILISFRFWLLFLRFFWGISLFPSAAFLLYF